MANISELLNGWGFGKQTAIGTANLVATIWRHTNLNTKPWAKVPVNEDDRAEIGKGHEFPTQLFKSHYNMPAYELSKYASSEFLAWAMSFSMGNVVMSGSGPYTYIIVPALGATNPTGLELPYFRSECLVGVPRVGDVLLHGQRRHERQWSVHVHHRSGPGCHEPDRPGAALLLVRAADPARWLGGAGRKAGVLRGARGER